MSLPFDTERVLAGLKDFQRRTVDYVFERMYQDEDATHRFLVADEVGLGKTLVARGIIAKTVERLWKTTDRIDVIYICSNSDIARQNINRLNITDSEDFVLSSRITLLPTQLKGINHNKLNFVSFTPGTSFDLRSTLGVQSERVLLYWLLDQAWGIARWGTGPMNVLRGYASAENFRAHLKAFDARSIEPSLAASFVDDLIARVAAARAAGQQDLRTLFEALSGRFQWKRKDSRIPLRDRNDRARFVGEVRALLARTCFEALEPDLVILDEFQRFKHLLSGEDEASQLARSLFEYSDENTKVRVLLLSATPYKMYTLSHEADEDHYEDFIHTLRFLQRDGARTDRVRGLLDEYRREMLRLRHHGPARILRLQDEIEAELRRYMVRTERLADSPDRNGMLKSVPMEGVQLEAEDVAAYRDLEQVADLLKQRGTLEYWKSSPYLLNLMDDYQLKKTFTAALRAPDTAPALRRLLSRANGLLLDWDDIVAYARVDSGNVRLRDLLARTVEQGLWRLLWIPPSLPYYQLGSPFDACADCTKQLVFSSWRVVPKAIATLVSYEVERRTFQAFEDEPRNTSEARRQRRPLLRFAYSNERLTGMPVLGILYPSITLAERCDPLRLARGRVRLDLEEILALATSEIQRALDDLRTGWDGDAPPDEAWYWAAPILLDLHSHSDAARAWLEQEELASTWSVSGDDDEESRWADHIDVARSLLAGTVLGRPPDDLAQVLAYMGLAGPGVASLRALWRIVSNELHLDNLHLRNSAAQVAWGFRQLFNTPEAMAIIRGLNAEEPYWQRVLAYAAAGNLQAVLDEYAHILCEALGLFDHTALETAREVAGAMREALTLRTVSFKVDDVRANGSVSLEEQRLRAHFALRFGDEQSDASSEPTRADQVRAAFNSPFWPFILATTSVGQEGLDFHQYSHAVVHWNLPSNPVDLEQREGRVHRYKGHAVRKNVALRHGAEVISAQNGRADLWSSLFELACNRRSRDESDLVPYWIYPVDGGSYIERHVPALPLSRDAQRLEDLRRSLAVYRMVFGQPRQEELVDYLLHQTDEREIASLSHRLRVDLTPPLKDPWEGPVGSP